MTPAAQNRRQPHAQHEASQQVHRRIPAAQVRELCGNVSDMTLWRWLNDPVLDFPKPIIIARRRYWRETDVIAWLEAREVAAAE